MISPLLSIFSLGYDFKTTDNQSYNDKVEYWLNRGISLTDLCNIILEQLP